MLVPFFLWRGCRLEQLLGVGPADFALGIAPCRTKRPRVMLDAVILSDIHLGSANCQAKSVCRLLERDVFFAFRHVMGYARRVRISLGMTGDESWHKNE